MNFPVHAAMPTTTALPHPLPPTLDLLGEAPLAAASNRLYRMPLGQADRKVVESLVTEDTPRDRMRRVAETFRKLDILDAVHFLKVAARMALDHDPAGIRLLFSFLEVKRPGVEVLHQLRGLSSLERVTLKLARGEWNEPEDAQDAHPSFAVVDVLQEGARVGALDLSIAALPLDSASLQSLSGHLRSWFGRVAYTLERGERLDEATMQFVTQLSMLEIHLVEKRVSNLAMTVDPYDTRALARLMPLLSRYDQDIEHMKGVVARLETYKPFFERMLTVEHALSSNEMDKLVRALNRDPLAAGIAQLTSAMRTHPLLDREFVYHVSQVHQLATVRNRVRELASPDLLSTMLGVIEHMQPHSMLSVRVEPEVLESEWATFRTWGAEHWLPDVVRLHYREDYTLEFIQSDGTPRLPERPEDKEKSELSLSQLVRMQLNNEPFILGILENPKATQRPGIVPMIAASTRSLRVLDKIMRSRSLYTGAANKDVPRLLLLNPSRIPVKQLVRFIHVRFVSKNELARLARPHSDVRPEVRKEVANYLRSLKA